MVVENKNPLQPSTGPTSGLDFGYGMTLCRAMADAHPTNVQSKHLLGYPFSTLPSAIADRTQVPKDLCSPAADTSPWLMLRDNA
ncbi:hypothetical protein Q9966_013910 [Columba livia]|nr:hypothetical protein Q9966_013910 [Columba livia]